MESQNSLFQLNTYFPQEGKHINLMMIDSVWVAAMEKASLDRQTVGNSESIVCVNDNVQLLFPLASSTLRLLHLSRRHGS